MNQALEGKTYAPVAFDVTEDRVRAFHDLFGGPPGVPPTFLTAAEYAVLPLAFDDPELGLDFSRVVHGSQEYVLHRPVRVGETLMVQARIASIRQKGGNGFLVVEMQMRGPEGELAAVGHVTLIERDMSS